MRVAVLDLGTNTFHLLLADMAGDRVQLRARYRSTVHLGREASSSTWRISEAAERRALEALHFFSSVLEKEPVGHILCVATAAFRMDHRGQAIAERLSRATGLPIDVISGQEEADLIYEGVRRQLPEHKNSFLIDIGGGSTECSIGTSQEKLWSMSFPLGAQLLLKRFFTNDPIPLRDQRMLRSYLSESLLPLSHALQAHKPNYLLGTSGSFTTIYDMYAALHSLAPLEDLCRLSITALREVYSPLLTLPREERLKLPGISKSRVDMLVMSALIIDSLLEMYPFEEIMISSWALKEGLLQRLIKRSTSSTSI